MPTYALCGQQTLAQVADMMHRYHERLEAAGVRVCCVFAHAAQDKNGEPKGPALKLHGYPCAALVRLNNLKQRVQGMADATIEIDGDGWDERPVSEQLAILDHELEHVELEAVGPSGAAKSDNCGRPKLWLRPHDFHGGGFKVIIERHGGDALEAKHCFDFSKALTQAMITWGDDQRPDMLGMLPRKATSAELAAACAAGGDAGEPIPAPKAKRPRREKVLPDGEIVQ
jgi:hypothetical protein